MWYNNLNKGESMIYTFGDTHGSHDIAKIFESGIEYKKDDYIIICGDFGVIWSDEKDAREIALESKLNALPCEVLFVDGNHENFNRIYALPQIEKFNSIVGQYSSNIFHLKRGHIYNIDNMNFLTMGGALSIDKNWRVRDISWWKQEAITEAELNLALKNIESFENNIDFVLSHTLPQRAVKEASKYMRTYHKEHDENPLKLEKIFELLQNKKHNVRAWICGHWHKDVSFSMKFLPRKRLKFFVLYNGISIGIDKNKKIKEVELRNGY